jgi:hypothetical protein
MCNTIADRREREREILYCFSNSNPGFTLENLIFFFLMFLCDSISI